MLTTVSAPTPTQHRILLEASRLFAERGYAGTSTREIAAAVGVRQPTLFHHFATKSLVMAELMRLNFDVPASAVGRISRQDGDPAVLLFRELRWELDYTRAVPYDLTSANAADVLALEDFASWRKVATRLRAARRAILRRGVADGSLVVPHEDVVLDGITGVMVDAVRRAGRPRGRQPRAEDVARFLVRAVIDDPRRLDAIAAEALSHRADDDRLAPRA
jgi:AcrR family transcriptional regulator